VILNIDFETRSTVDLKATGVYPYAAHADTDIWCMAWSLDDQEPEIWTPDDGRLPQPVIDHIAQGHEIHAWNAQFERIMWREIMVKRYGALQVALDQWYCTAARAAAMSLPRSLDQASRVTGVAAQKDGEGYALMMRMARPRKIMPDGTIVWWNEPKKLERLYDYCKQDVRTEQALAKALLKLPPMEREIYLLDQKMNDRGIMVDEQLANAAAEIAEEGIARADSVISTLTGGKVSGVTKAADLRAWLSKELDEEIDSIDKAALRDLLERELSPEQRQVLEARAEAGKSSIAKIQKMLNARDTDGAIKGMLLYYGASTGRWTGRLVQPHNFPRGDDVPHPERFIPMVLDNDYDGIDAFHPPVAVVSALLRGMLIARPGRVFLAADFSAIEARVLNWIAGQEDMLENFRAYDKGDKTRDPYVQNAMRLFKLAFADVKKFPHRQTGKFQELGCGYQMGKKKAQTAAKDVYGLTITAEEAATIVDNYRSTHGEVVDLWWKLEDAAFRAVEKPGKRVEVVLPYTKISFLVVGAYLYCRLPSGRNLCYPGPKIVDGETPWGAPKKMVEVWGMDSYTHQWSAYNPYGGFWAENIGQAVSRDLLAEAQLRVDTVNLFPILSVHDEVVAEPTLSNLEHLGADPVKEFEKLMSLTPTWAEGCPVAAEAWTGQRYHK